MRINPVLKNEGRLATRNIRFSMMILVFIALLSIGGIFLFKVNIVDVNARGIDLSGNIFVYISIAFIEAILLLFIVPALTATVICSEREKQTLDILLSTSMSPLSIVVGKLISSVSKVVILIIATMPVYAITFFIGGVNIGNIVSLSLFFIVATFFVGSIGLFISTVIKTSKASTATTYGVTLFVFIVILIVSAVWMALTIDVKSGSSNAKLPVFCYLSPIIGFVSMLINQVGGIKLSMIGGIYIIPCSDHAVLISVVVQIVITVILVLLSAYKLNPLNKKKILKK
ncbi:ABC transporter permease [Clostridium bornimense]|uniref:ABC transporter permease n=1 Tax=Clostridium bornimense TaxID=1216932 RepID=UPI001C0F3FEB|nr:ABC transporter permease [Clostridium bornimense]MBU5316719.1 ABC transporter permease [Clostridium bornimense]